MLLTTRPLAARCSKVAGSVVRFACPRSPYAWNGVHRRGLSNFFLHERHARRRSSHFTSPSTGLHGRFENTSRSSRHETPMPCKDTSLRAGAAPTLKRLANSGRAGLHPLGKPCFQTLPRRAASWDNDASSVCCHGYNRRMLASFCLGIRRWSAVFFALAEARSLLR